MDSYIGQIILAAFMPGRVPSGFLPCDGRTLQVSSTATQALFAVIGNQYGGNGSTTFSLPNLPGPAATNAQWSSPTYFICYQGTYPYFG